MREKQEPAGSKEKKPSKPDEKRHGTDNYGKKKAWNRESAFDAHSTEKQERKASDSSSTAGDKKNSTKEGEREGKRAPLSKEGSSDSHTTRAAPHLRQSKELNQVRLILGRRKS